MPTFTYKAKNLRGEAVEGSYDTATREELEYMLRDKGFFLVESTVRGNEVSMAGLLKRITVKDLAVFCRQFAVIINAGITIVEAVGILRDQTEKPKFKVVLSEVHEQMQKGRVLSEALKLYPDVFPDFLTSMIRVGESSGALDTVLNRLADYYERDSKVRKKVRTAMTYPTILGVLTVGVIILLMVMVLPMFSGMLSEAGAEMPGITKVLMGISDFLVNNLALVLLAIVAIVGGLVYWFRTPRGRFQLDGMKLSLPVVKGLTVKVITSRFARSMSILLKSGIPIINAMEIMGGLIGNRVVEEKFESCRDEIKEGRGVAVPIRKLGLFPPLLIHMIAVGESTGELDEMLARTAGFFDDEVEEAIDKMTAMVEPAMIIIMAAIVGSIILSIMLPMVSILGTIQ